MAVFAWGHMMHEQDACSSFGAKLQCWKGRIGETHIGVSRGPQTLWPSGQRWQPEITRLGVPQTSVGRVVFTAGLSKPAPYTVSVVRVFSLPQGNQRSFPDPILRPVGSIPCVASSATTWVNLPNVGGQPTRMYQVRQWACNSHFAHGRTLALQYRLKSSTRVTLSSLSGTITGPWWKGRSLFQFLPVSSVRHLNYESRNYGIRYVGHQWAVFATSSRSSTERNLHPGCGSYNLGHCHM